MLLIFNRKKKSLFYIIYSENNEFEPGAGSRVSDAWSYRDHAVTVPWSCLVFQFSGFFFFSYFIWILYAKLLFVKGKFFFLYIYDLNSIYIWFLWNQYELYTLRYMRRRKNFLYTSVWPKKMCFFNLFRSNKFFRLEVVRKFILRHKETKNVS